MKKLVQVQEIEGEGLEALMGEQVILFCGNYFWAGKLIGARQVMLSTRKHKYWSWSGSGSGSNDQ